MKKQKYRSLAYAVALAVSCAAVPGTSFAAEAQPAEAANTAAANTAAAEDTAAAAKAVTQETAKTETAVKAADTSAAAQADAAANSSIDERTQTWAKTRPEETAIADGMKQYEGQTVVDTIFEGTSKATEGTAKAAISMKAGDMFTVKGLDADREKIYNTGYFYDIYPTFEKVPEGVIITYHVLENPVLKGVNITGNTVESSDTLNSFVTLKTGEILNSRELNKAVTAIQEQYRRDGYILAKITDMNIDKNGILNLKVNEGILEGYKVKGNTKTKERVILREMRQKPGEPFNSKLARRSMQRVYNLGFFEDVNIKMNPGVDPNAVVMELDVTEKRTGSFGIGAGYSSEDGVIGMVSIGDTNFRGTGDKVNFHWEFGGAGNGKNYTISYTRPWINSNGDSLGASIFNRIYEYDDYDSNGDTVAEYDKRRSGWNLTWGRQNGEYRTNYFTFESAKEEYDDHDGFEWGSVGNNQTDAVKAEWKKAIMDNFGTTNSFTFSHVFDNRDNYFNASKGRRISFTTQWGGHGLGGDYDFYKFTTEGRFYKGLGNGHILALRLQGGYIDGDVSYGNLFDLGGSNTLRGYEDDQFKGKKMYAATLEYRFPIAKKVQGVLFTDGGSTWGIDDGQIPWYEDDDGFQWSCGVGLRLQTPIGPIRLDYGHGDKNKFHFSFGTQF